MKYLPHNNKNTIDVNFQVCTNFDSNQEDTTQIGHNHMCNHFSKNSPFPIICNHEIFMYYMD